MLYTYYWVHYNPACAEELASDSNTLVTSLILLLKAFEITFSITCCIIWHLLFVCFVCSIIQLDIVCKKYVLYYPWPIQSCVRVSTPSLLFWPDHRGSHYWTNITSDKLHRCNLFIQLYLFNKTETMKIKWCGKVSYGSISCKIKRTYFLHIYFFF